MAAVQLDALAPHGVRPKGGERIAILIDLPDPREVKDFRFLRAQTLKSSATRTTCSIWG